MKVLKVMKNTNVVVMDDLVSYYKKEIFVQDNSFFLNETKDLIIDDGNRTRTIIDTVTFEETAEDELGEKNAEKISAQQNLTPQFKQLEPLKMVKRDISKEYIPSSSSTSSADTIINTKIYGQRLGL